MLLRLDLATARKMDRSAMGSHVTFCAEGKTFPISAVARFKL